MGRYVDSLGCFDEDQMGENGGDVGSWPTNFEQSQPLIALHPIEWPAIFALNFLINIDVLPL